MDPQPREHVGYKMENSTHSQWLLCCPMFSCLNPISQTELKCRIRAYTLSMDFKQGYGFLVPFIIGESSQKTTSTPFQEMTMV